MMEQSKSRLMTPDGRYFVVKGQLWRSTNPNLAPDVKTSLVRELMSARRALKGLVLSSDAVREARARVDAAKHALGERGAVWWTDGAPDYNRKKVMNTPYASWFQLVDEARSVVDAQIRQ